MATPKIEAWGEISSFGQKLRDAVVKFGHRLNFDQFSQVVVSVLEPAGASSSAGTLAFAAREAGKPQTLSTTLRARFDLIDADGSGTIGVSECLRFMLREALAATATQVAGLLNTWDEDKNGQVSRIEFRSALKELGLTEGIDKADVDAVLDEFDADRSGEISLAELRTRLRQYAGLTAENKIPLRKASTGYKSKVVVALDAGAGDVRAQLKAALSANMARVIDLFRDWDENGDGMVSKKEFRMAMKFCGFKAAQNVVDSLFDECDVDGGGTVEYSELSSFLRGSGKKDGRGGKGGKGGVKSRAQEEQDELARGAARRAGRRTGLTPCNEAAAMTQIFKALPTAAAPPPKREVTLSAAIDR